MVILTAKNDLSLTTAMLFSSLLVLVPVSHLGAQHPTAVVADFLKSHCSTCHSDSTKEGSLDISALNWQVAGDLQKLVRIYERVQDGEMPPKSERGPTKESKETFLSELSSSLIILDKERIKRDGRSMKRRLNRYEYENTLRDLLNLPWLQVREMLPEDGELNRFNKSGEALDVSHVHLSRYMSAADYALRQAVGRVSSIFSDAGGYSWGQFRVSASGRYKLMLNHQPIPRIPRSTCRKFG